MCEVNERYANAGSTEMTSLGDKEFSDTVDCDTLEEMTSNQSKELYSNAVMADSSATKEIESSNKGLLDYNRDKEVKSNHSHDDGMKDNSIKGICRNVSMMDHGATEEHPFKIKQERIANKEAHEKLSSDERSKDQRNDSSFQQGNCSNNCSIGKCTSATDKDDTDWDYNVIHVDSSDLQVVGGHSPEEFTAGNNYHQDAPHIQKIGIKVTATREITSTDNGRNRQKPDIKKVTPQLKFRKILPKFVIPYYKVVTHNIDGQGKEVYIDPNLNPSKCEQNANCVKTDTHEEKVSRDEDGDAIGGQYKCTYCTKTFAAQSDVKEHEQTHTSEKPFKCAYCNKGFPGQSHLKRHEILHTGASPHKCKYCGKAFRNKWDVEVHERTHTGEKPYTCKLCNKAFTQRSGLNVHGRVHSGVAPYRCNQCNKAFTRKSHLMEHERIHTGVKPYECPYCNKCFTQKGTLKKHERTHTAVNPYPCKNCYKSFTRQSDLWNHERIHRDKQV